MIGVEQESVEFDCWINRFDCAWLYAVTAGFSHYGLANIVWIQFVVCNAKFPICFALNHVVMLHLVPIVLCNIKITIVNYQRAFLPIKEWRMFLEFIQRCSKCFAFDVIEESALLV